MSEELKLQESVKKTQELLGKYIKKPPLTDKLLKKPPFRFLHDIINAIIKETGFLKNLFTDDESNSGNIKDKEAKLAYLNKLIDAVKLITGNELLVRPSKIISGQEPIKTNELLQAIGRALDKKVSSAEAIEYYTKNLEKKESMKIKSNKVNVSLDETTAKQIKKSSSSESKSSSREKLKDKDDKKKRDVKLSTREVKIRERSNDRRDPKKAIRETKKKDVTADVSKKKKGQTSTDKHATIDKKKIKSPSPTGELKKNEVTEPGGIISDPVQKEEDDDNHPSVVPDEHSELVIQETKEEIIIDKINEEEQKVMSPKKLKENLEKTDKESMEATIKSTAGLLRPPSARPPSARPAAPKIRGKPDFIINNSAINQMGDVSVIIENFTVKDDDDDDDADDMVVMETTTNNDSLLINGTTDLLNAQLTQEHGYLVAQILDTQRELVNESNVELIPNKVEIEWEAGLKKDRDIIVKEIDKLRGTIQSLTRTTNPLGKLLDFLQEDAEIMEKEYNDWRNQFITIREQLIIERNMKVESLKPLEESLKEVESSIVNQMEKIFQTKANIMKNNQKIQKLLSGK